MMTARENAVTPADDPEGNQLSADDDIFAGLTGLDVIHGELVPRSRRRRA